jgi:hypothetical protein
MGMNYVDVAAWNAATSQAQAAAQAAYQQSQAANEGERVALDRAKFAWQKEIDRAGLTGMFEGNPTVPYQFQTANTFGNWGTPTAGQETLQKNQQQYQQAYQNSLAYGQYYAPGSAPTAGQQTQQAQQQAWAQQAANAAQFGSWFAPGQGPAAGQQTQAAQQQQFTQGLQTGQEARAAQAQQQQQAMSYLNLLSTLRGPADWAKYQQVLGSTPGGMRDLAAAAMGQYVPGGGATTGVAPQAASLQSLMGDVSGQPYSGQGGGQLNMPSVYGGGQGSYQQQAGQIQAPGGGWKAPGGQYGQYTGPALPGMGFQTNAQTMQNQYYNQPGGGAFTNVQTMGGAGAAPGSQNNPMGQLPAPNQIAPASWKNMAPSQQQMLLGAYEGQGWDKNDVTALFNQSLPRYAANAPSAGTWRLTA